MDPKAQMMLITPINDHNLSSKSIVISADEEVTVELGKRRSQKDEWWKSVLTETAKFVWKWAIVLWCAGRKIRQRSVN